MPGFRLIYQFCSIKRVLAATLDSDKHRGRAPQERVGAETNARKLVSRVCPLGQRQSSMQNKGIKVTFHVFASVVEAVEQMWERCCLIRASLVRTQRQHCKKCQQKRHSGINYRFLCSGLFTNKSNEWCWEKPFFVFKSYKLVKAGCIWSRYSFRAALWPQSNKNCGFVPQRKEKLHPQSISQVPDFEMLFFCLNQVITRAPHRRKLQMLVLKAW